MEHFLAAAELFVEGDGGGIVRRLNAMFGTAFGEPETYGGDPPAEAYLAQVLAKPNVVALVALSGGEVVGGLVAYPGAPEYRCPILFPQFVRFAGRREGAGFPLSRE
jgi:hypothetical protein